MDGMERLASRLAEIRRSPVSVTIRQRMEEFSKKGGEGDNALFLELCFCLLTANYTSEGGIRIQNTVGGGFLRLTEKKLSRRLSSLGYRFPNTRARYIVEARRHMPLRKLLHGGEYEVRERLADTVLGLGFKESSHFLRNIGFRGLAIIDFHIIDLLAGYGLIERPKQNSLSRKRYLEIERVLSEVCRRCGLCQAELDLYLWYMETGKVLK